MADISWNKYFDNRMEANLDWICNTYKWERDSQKAIDMAREFATTETEFHFAFIDNK